MITGWYKIKLEDVLDSLLVLGRTRSGVLQFAGEESKRLYDIIEQVNRVLGELEKDLEIEKNKKQ